MRAEVQINAINSTAALWHYEPTTCLQLTAQNHIPRDLGSHLPEPQSPQQGTFCQSLDYFQQLLQLRTQVAGSRRERIGHNDRQTADKQANRSVMRGRITSPSTHTLGIGRPLSYTPPHTAPTRNPPCTVGASLDVPSCYGRAFPIGYSDMAAMIGGRKQEATSSPSSPPLSWELPGSRRTLWKKSDQGVKHTFWVETSHGTNALPRDQSLHTSGFSAQSPGKKETPASSGLFTEYSGT